MEENNMNLVQATNAPQKQQPMWKNILITILDIVIIWAVVKGVNYYYTNEVMDKIDQNILSYVKSSFSSVEDMGLICSVELVDEDDLPQPEKYSWEEVRDGGGKVAKKFSKVMDYDDFNEIIKVGKSVKCVQQVRTLKVYTHEEFSDESPQYAGDVTISVYAFYQGHAKNGILFCYNTEWDDSLQAHIASYMQPYEDNTDQDLDEVFTLQSSEVDTGAKVISIYYQWTNTVGEAMNPGFAVELTAFQGDEELTTDYADSENISIDDTVAVGDTGTVKYCFYLKDTTMPVKVVATNVFNHWFAENPPKREFMIDIEKASQAVSQQSSVTTSADLDNLTGMELYHQFIEDMYSTSEPESLQTTGYAEEEYREYINDEDPLESALLNLYDSGACGELKLYMPGDCLSYTVTFEEKLVFDGYSVNCYWSDDTGDEFFLINSGNQEWLIARNFLHEDGIAYRYAG